MVKVSFIIPVYNVESYIQRCIESVLALGLTEQEMEIVCIDDCSPDNSADVVKQLSEKYSSIRLIRHLENRRQGGARNTGINNARGEYCILLDADDTLPNYNIMEVLKQMDEANLDILLGKAMIRNKDTVKVWGNPFGEETSLMSGLDFFVDYRIHTLAYGVVWLGIYRTSFLKKIPPFRENVQMEDADWCYQALYHAQRVQYQPVEIYHYWVNSSSTTHQRQIRQLIEMFQQVCIIYQLGETNRAKSEWGYKCTVEYARWRLHCLNGLWQYSNADRKLFFQSIDQVLVKQMCKSSLDLLPRNILEHPVFSRFIFAVVSPFLKAVRIAKKKLRNKRI